MVVHSTIPSPHPTLSHTITPRTQTPPHTLRVGQVNEGAPELQLNKANTSDTEATFLDLHLSIPNGFVSSKFYYKRDDFDIDMVNFPFLDGDVPRRPSYRVHISQLIRFARVCSHVILTAKLLKQGYRYHKLRKAIADTELISNSMSN